MTLLTALQWVQRQCSLPVTSSIVGDAQESQQLLFALAQEEAEELAARHEWPELRDRLEFTGPGDAVDQYESEFWLPANVDNLRPETLWNETRRVRLRGPVRVEQWRLVRSSFWVPTQLEPIWIVHRSDAAPSGRRISVAPPVAAGDVLALSIVENTPVRSSAGEPKETFDADTDVFVLGEDLLKRGVRWRYLAQKGLDYAEHMKSYERWVQNRINAKSGAGEADLTARRNALPLATIPEGDW